MARGSDIEFETGAKFSNHRQLRQIRDEDDDNNFCLIIAIASEDINVRRKDTSN